MGRMKRLWWVAALSLGVGSAQGVVSRIPTDAQWKLFRTGAVGKTSAVQRAGAPTLRFEADRVVGTTDCGSTFTAPFSQQGARVKFGLVTRSVQNCGLPAQGVLERRFLESLGKARRVGLKNDFLVLFTSDRQTLTFKRER